MTIETRLTNMIGKSYMYKTYIHRIASFKITPETVIIGTDKEILVFNYRDINRNLEDFLEIEDEDENEQTSAITIFSKDSSSDFLNEIKQNIADIKKDPKNIEKAKAINDCLKTLIDFGRLQVETLKLKKFRGR